MGGARRPKGRVCMVVHAYYPLAEPRVQREARAARDAGFSVEVLCLRGEGERPREEVDGVTVVRLPLAHHRGAPALRLLVEYALFAVLATCAVAWRLARRELSVVQIHSPPEFLMAAAILPKLAGVTVILDVHDLSRHMFMARFGGGFAGAAIKWVLERMERVACGMADHVITVHQPYRHEMVMLGTPGERISVIMNSVDETLLNEVREPLAEKPDGELVLAYHGTLNEWYGVGLIVEAVALLQDRFPAVSAIILGDGDDLPKLRALADELDVADRIYFSGRYVPILDALRAVRHATCGVIPNRPTELNRFALSSKLFEYVGLEVPVVVARLETLAAHFDDTEVTFFEPASATSLATAVEQVALDPAGAERKAKRALRRSVEYSWEKNATRYLALLTGGHRPPSARAPDES